MNQYTIKQSKSKRRLSDLLDVVSNGLSYAYKAFLFLARVTRKAKQKVDAKSIKLLDSSKGITFTIIKALLQDRYSLRLTVMDTTNGKKYYCYHKGDYSDVYLKNKGGELAVIEEYYYICSSEDWWDV